MSPPNMVSTPISMATESEQANASYSLRNRKPAFLYGGALRAKRGRKKIPDGRDRDKDNHKECK